MARKRYASRRRGSGRGSGMMSFIKPMLFGAIGDELATQASARGMNVISHQDKLAGAAGGFLAKRTPMGAILGVAGGMLKDVAFGRNPMASVAGGATGTPALELH